MKITRNGMLVGLLLAELLASSSLWGQAATSGDVGGIDIIVKKKPTGKTPSNCKPD